MAQESSHPQAKTLIADPPGLSLRSLQNFVRKRMTTWRQIKIWDASNMGHGLLTICAVTAGLSMAIDPTSQRLERQVQSQFFNIRGAVAPPNEVIILAMDEASNSQAKNFYAADPKKYAYLEPLTTSPWKRSAYAQAIDRVMSAGAKSVGVDLIFDLPSSYPQEDLRFQKTLQRYAGRIALALEYAESIPKTGSIYQIQIKLPQEMFQTQPGSLGSINYLTEAADDEIRMFASEYPRRVILNSLQAGNVQIAKNFEQMASQYPAFSHAVLNASKITYQPPKGENIFFYGPAETFTQIPFWEVLDPETWENHRRKKTFEGKIVLIGPTAASYQDAHFTPFGKMPGVEINANAIATLLENRSISAAIPSLPAQGVFVALLVLFAGYVQSRNRQISPLLRFGIAIALALGWVSISYSVFVAGRLILPTAMPVMAIVLSGASYFVSGLRIKELKLHRAAQLHSASPDVQNFIHDTGDRDLGAFIHEQNQDIIGRRLDGRYEVLEELGSGGFGKTYKARDTQRPGSPLCVVKQLRPVNTRPKALEVAETLFAREARTLELLGKHDQIPQLLAYREDQLYLVQEFIEGNSLHKELFGKFSSGRLPERKVIYILQDLLQVLEFIHGYDVIHRDIKPANVIRRQSDGRLVLIDFGAVREIAQQLEQTNDTQSDNSVNRLTVAIGTDGFMAPEQALGQPRFSSDIYSVGIVGILALTGMSARELNQTRDPETNEFRWREHVQVSHALAEILDKMVRYNHTDRYQSATGVLTNLKPLFEQTKKLWEQTSSAEPLTLPLEDETERPSLEETKAWPEPFSADSRSSDPDADNRLLA
ncbi:MAG: protein kinase [Leptolyngbya sp.]|nr:MAG: protein kinase [Leptolyngbya sp.]